MKNVNVTIFTLTGAVCLMALTLSGCSSSYEPVVDLKSTKNPGLVQEDQMECEWIANHYGLESEAEKQCMQNRGVSIIGERKP